MVNVHLNGDIVRCPDIREIHKKAAEIRDQHKICKYGFHENTCSAWLCAVRTHKFCGRCSLAGSDQCPGHKRRTETGKKEKSYSIDAKVYRKLSSAAHYMVKKSKRKTIFITLTFPPFKKNKYNENEINKSFSRFIHNLHENYAVKYYVAVKEYCPTSGRPHFHVLLSIRFASFIDLNNAWCCAISGLCKHSKNALTTNKNAVIIRTPERAMRYACKYFSKCRGSRNNTRLVFVSNNLLSHPETKITYNEKTGEIFEIKRIRVSNIQKSINIPVNKILEGYKSIYILQTSDYSTAFRITDKNEFSRFCQTYLYNLFELTGNFVNFSGVPGSLN